MTVGDGAHGKWCPGKILQNMAKGVTTVYTKQLGLTKPFTGQFSIVVVLQALLSRIKPEQKVALPNSTKETSESESGALHSFLG